MFFGQINAPATLPICVLMHLVNNKFLSRLYRTLEPVACYFNAIQRSLSFSSDHKHATEMAGRRHSTVKPHSRCHALCYIKYICVMACFVLEFSSCVSRSRPWHEISSHVCWETRYSCSVGTKTL